MMTPEPVDPGTDEQENSNGRLETILKIAGAATLDDLEERIGEMKLGHKTFQKQRLQISKLEDELETLRQKKEDESYGLLPDSDRATLAVARQVSNLEKRLTSIQAKVLRTVEDDELEPYMDQAMSKHPYIRTIPDPEDRLNAARDIARGLRAEKEMSADRERARQSGERKALSSSRAYVERGGTGFSGSRPSEEEDLKHFEAEFKKAESDGKRQAVLAKYRRMYPDWGL
jgi:hypothetical protein